MEILFLALLVLIMAGALSSGFPVAFSLPGAAIVTIAIAAAAGAIFAGDSDAFFFNGGPNQWLNAGVTNFRSLYWNVERDTLIAIPLFVFMGLALQRSRIAEDLLIAMAKLFGPIPGGLGISVVFVGALLAATTGIVGATVIAMGLISLPAMLRNNYSPKLACGTICASGTLGQIIPPSIVLIILADQLSSAASQAGSIRKELYKSTTGEFSMPSSFDVVSASAGDMFMGAFIPGMILVAIYMAYILITSWLKPEQAPPVPYHGKYDRAFFFEVFMALMPPLALIFTVLGSILFGIATVNQAGAIGAVGSLLMASYRLMQGSKSAYYPTILAVLSVLVLLFLANYFDLSIKNSKQPSDYLATYAAVLVSLVLLGAVAWSIVRVYRVDNTLNEIMIETAKTTSMVFIILIGAAMLTSAFRAFGGEELVKHSLTGLPGGFWVQFFVVMLVIFLLGFFLDFIEIAIVVVPLVAPVLLADPAANVTAVWLGVMIGLNIQTSFLTPPFGFALFYLRGVAPAIIKTVQIYKGAIAFILLQLAGLAVAGLFPVLINFLPNRTYLVSDTAPPPNSPYLQSCIEEMVLPRYQELRIPVEQQLATIRQIDNDFLPEALRSRFNTAVDSVPEVFVLAQQAQSSAKKLSSYAQDYAALHESVRRDQASIRRLQAEMNSAREKISDLRFSSKVENGRLESLQQEILNLEAEQKEIEAQLPAQWPEANAGFVSLQKDSTLTLSRYRQLADTSYQDLMGVRDLLSGVDVLSVNHSSLEALAARVVSGANANLLAEDILSFKQGLDKLPRKYGSNNRAITSSLNSAVSALKESSNFAQAAEYLNQTGQEMQAEIAWRTQGVGQLLPALNRLDGLIATNIGLRRQKKLPEGSENDIALCLSEHKDVSLSF